MLALIALLLSSNLHADVVLGTSDEQYLLYTKDQLAKAGYIMRVEADKVRAENKNRGVSLTMNARAETVIYEDKKTKRQQAFDIRTTEDGKKALAITNCTPDGRDERKVLCRTVTANYCHALISKSGWKDADLTKLKECDQILSTLDYDQDDVRIENEDAMKRIASDKKVIMANFEPSIGKPRSLGSLLLDYAACEKNRDGWAPAKAAVKSNREDIKTEQ